jgi:hypothetical protein
MSPENICQKRYQIINNFILNHLNFKELLKRDPVALRLEIFRKSTKRNKNNNYPHKKMVLRIPYHMNLFLFQETAAFYNLYSSDLVVYTIILN